MLETIGIFLRVCLSAGCYYFPQPFQTVAKCTAQGAVEISGKTGAKIACPSVSYMMATGPQGPQGVAGLTGPVGPMGPAGPQGPAGSGTSTGTNYLTAN
jgi:hypothetical protein